MNLQPICKLQQVLRTDGACGLFIKAGNPDIIEAAGYGGFDFCILDMEHGPCSFETLGGLIRAAEAASIAPVVRVAGCSEEYISKALDLGAAGVQIPQVSSREDAENAVRFAKFFPRGQRGVCRYVRAASYSAQEPSSYFSQSNEAMVILQIEGQEGIQNLDAILQTEGFDVLFIGPYDLSQSLGFTGEVHHPAVISQMKSVVERAAQMGICVGTFVDTPEDGKLWKSMGVRYIAHSVDVGIFYTACRSIVRELHQ